MNSSGIKRGLATTAVSALAIAGLPLFASSASATPLTAQEAAGSVTIQTPTDAGFASFKNDGTDTKIHIVAEGGPDVIQVQFEYLDGVTWKPIATVARENGAFSAFWEPPTAIYNLPVQIRATGISNVGTPIGGAQDINTATVTANQEAVDITNAPGSSVGVFQQPYTTETKTDYLGSVSGTTSDVAANPNVTISTPYNATTTTEDVAETPGTGATSRTFSGPVNFNTYPWSGATPPVDEALINVADGSSDTEAVKLYKQTIGGVTATARKSTVQNGDTTTVDVKVVDQNGAPVVGAQVLNDADKNGTINGAEAFAYTNSQGVASFAGLGGSANGTVYSFYVNTTDVDAYENGVDFVRTVTVTSYSAVPTTLTASSVDGSAFDRSEYAGGDITALLKDQNGNPIPNADIRYSWVEDSFAAGVPDATTAEATATTGPDGKATLSFPNDVEGTYTLKYYLNLDGTPGQGTGDLGGSAFSVKAGDAEITWADGATAQAKAGTTATFKGTMALDDGTGLPGRNVAITWAPTGNAVVAAQSAQPANTTRTADGAATSKTAADGSFSVAISDPATPAADELNGVLDATGTATTGIGNSAAPAPNLDVDFLLDPAVSTLTTTTSQAAISGDNKKTPGRPVAVKIVVKNAAGTLLTDLPVTMKTDHGFFVAQESGIDNGTALTLSDLIPDPAAAAGANYGEWKSLGDSVATTTDDNGVARGVVGIERDAGFDDDGSVTAKVTVTVGGQTFTEPVVFSSADQLNPGTVTIELAPANEQTVSVLPKAPTSERVKYYARATDQFGNLVITSIKLSDNSAVADVENGAGTPITAINSSYTNGGSPFYASADSATSQVITGLWDDAPTVVWKDAVTDVPGVPATIGFQEEAAGVDGTDNTKTKDVTGASSAVDWYVIDYAKSTFSLTHTGADVQPVGTTVTETYKAVDQNGEPLSGFDVTFYRTGPDDLQDGDGNSYGTTNAAGEATYVFQGAKAGKATITAVLREADNSNLMPSGTIVPQGEKSDVVEFAGPVDTKTDVVATLTGEDNGGRADVLTLTTDPAAAGALATLYKVAKDGTRTPFRFKTLDNEGKVKFRGKDKNGNRKTKYVAVVDETDTTKSAESNTKSVR